MADPNPLSTFFMEAVLEERPTKAFRLGPRIGGRFLPLKGYTNYRIVWDKVREYSPIAGAYALEDLPDTMDELDFETFQSDVLHWGSRMTLSPKQIMFLRMPGQGQVSNVSYGTGPAADDMRAKDAAKIADYTRMMNEALENVFEFLRMGSLLGQIWWPPKTAAGANIAAADVPLSMGRQKLNHAIPFLASSAAGGGFHQAATTLTGITGGVAATGVAWNAAALADPIKDMAVIMDLLEDRMNLTTENLLVLMARRVLAHVANQTAVLNWILGKQYERDRTFITISEIRNYVQTQFEWTIEFYQSKWEYVAQSQFDQPKPTVNQVPFMNYGTVLILPNPEIQEMGVLATAPAPGPAHQWRDGKYLWMYTEPKPPFGREMGMGGFYWPLVFDNDVRFRLDAWG